MPTAVEVAHLLPIVLLVPLITRGIQSIRYRAVMTEQLEERELQRDETASINKSRCPKHGYYQGGGCPECAIEQIGNTPTLDRF